MKFLTPNKVERFSSITVVSGDASKVYLYDRDSTTKWTSAGSDDTTVETITIVFAAAQTIDRICFRNHNLKQFTCQYWDGAAYADFSTPISETTNTDTDNFYTVNSVSTLRLQITATKTHVVDAQKYIGEFLAYAEYFDIPDEYLPETENLNLYYKQTEHEKVNGGSIIVISATRNKYQNSFSYSGSSHLPLTYRNNIETLKNLHASFWFIPDDATPANQYYCNLIDFQFNRVSVWTTVGGAQCYDGFFSVKET